MALYGARTLDDERRVDPRMSSAELVDELIVELLQGAANSQVLLASELVHVAGMSLAAHAEPVRAEPSLDLDSEPTSHTDLEGLREEETDLAEGAFATGASSRGPGNRHAPRRARAWRSSIRRWVSSRP
jgi:hypothetical protein